MTSIDIADLDVREKLAHIDQMLADHDRKRQEMVYQPIIVMISGMISGAALLAAGAALEIAALRSMVLRHDRDILALKGGA
jgi:hypothetical protein